MTSMLTLYSPLAAAGQPLHCLGGGWYTVAVGGMDGPVEPLIGTSDFLFLH